MANGSHSHWQKRDLTLESPNNLRTKLKEHEKTRFLCALLA